MPELPEVETICRGIAPLVVQQKITSIVVHQAALRWPVPTDIQQATNSTVLRVTRRSKYILITTEKGTLIIHLGMTGRLLVVPLEHPISQHEHVTFNFDNYALSFVDPRRFGAVVWTQHDPLQHPLLQNLGLEPFDSNFDGAYLQRKARNRKITIKQFLMDSSNVSGLGNIYANEALFLANIHPQTLVNNLPPETWDDLAKKIPTLLNLAIQQGGTTLRDYRNSAGKPGNFKTLLQVYDRKGLPCKVCNTPIQHLIQKQRSTFYCPTCQKYLCNKA